MRMSPAARAYRALPTSRQRYDNGRPATVQLDEDAIAYWHPFGPDAVRVEITRQLVDRYGRRATTPGEYRLLTRWVRYEVADEMASRYPPGTPVEALSLATLIRPTRAA
ncbi:hypothetical protein HC028_18530 [Planosporangium flavigriseum]|uniref:Uncharacterized protein n=1 Tax=Planosporangium flavigriseum TaxID=373681 RepID=A0A8J3LPA7_9ACTN|nr:hypothetical protein [Planosporangium flavigriseum]NJC66485.1 hypothetical protein [Planosporangium flavigriseum]GIG76362.1 hypothetical protein Pfl04_47660 [Planosporangium flavigriseum]